MRKIYILLMIFGMFVTTTIAEMVNFDTRLGLYKVGNTSVSYRNTRLSAKVLPLITPRIVNNVYNGIGATGELNNYRIGLQGVFELKTLVIGFSISPFAGFSISGSDNISNSFSFDFGFDSKHRILSWLNAIVGAEAITFSDSYMLDYYGGVSLAVPIKIMSFITIDLLYTGLLSNSSHRIGGGARLSFRF